MSRKRSRSHNKLRNAVDLVMRDPEIQERVDDQLIFKNQLEIADKILRRLSVSSLNAGFINASGMFAKTSQSFSQFVPGLTSSIEQKIEALESLDN